LLANIYEEEKKKNIMEIMPARMNIVGWETRPYGRRLSSAWRRWSLLMVVCSVNDETRSRQNLAHRLWNSGYVIFVNRDNIINIKLYYLTIIYIT
jgi:hypothetical protein